MKPCVRDGLLIVLFLVIAALLNLRFLHQAGDLSVWLTGATTGVLWMCAVTLGTQIIKQRKKRHGT